MIEAYHFQLKNFAFSCCYLYHIVYIGEQFCCKAFSQYNAVGYIFYICSPAINNVIIEVKKIAFCLHINAIDRSGYINCAGIKKYLCKYFGRNANYPFVTLKAF